MSGPHVNPGVHSDVNHDESDVYVYESSEIAEGNARVPLWLLAAILTLFAFFAFFIVTYWNAQPSTAQMNSK